MTTFYIDPSANVNGDGSIESPFNSWDNVTWTAGNSYLQKAGTTFNGQISIGASGNSLQSRIYLGKYGTGALPKIEAVQYGIFIAARQFLFIEDFEITNATDHGIYIRTSGSNIENITINRCIAHHNQNNGFFLDGVVLTATIKDVYFNDCVAYENKEHGWDCLGIVKNVYWQRCTAYKNGALVLGHGFSIHPFASTNQVTGWTVVSGNVYSRTLSASESVQKVINRSAGVTITKNVGAGISVGLNQWDQSGTTFYINIGSDPNVSLIAWKRAEHGPFFYFNCTSFENYTDAGPGEGHGFASDDMTGPSFYFNCIAFNNEGAGFQNQWGDNVWIENCLSFKNQLSNFRTTGHTDNYTILNCTSAFSNDHGYFFAVPFSNITFTNNISTKNNLYGFAAEGAGITSINCLSFNNPSGASLNFSDTNLLTTDPLLNIGYKIYSTSSPAKYTGAVVNSQFKENIPPSRGAFEYMPVRSITSTRTMRT